MANDDLNATITMDIHSSGYNSAADATRISNNSSDLDEFSRANADKANKESPLHRQAPSATEFQRQEELARQQERRNINKGTAASLTKGASIFSENKGVKADKSIASVKEHIGASGYYYDPNMQRYRGPDGKIVSKIDAFRRANEQVLLRDRFVKPSEVIPRLLSAEAAKIQSGTRGFEFGLNRALAAQRTQFTGNIGAAFAGPKVVLSNLPYGNPSSTAELLNRPMVSGLGRAYGNRENTGLAYAGRWDSGSGIRRGDVFGGVEKSVTSNAQQGPGPRLLGTTNVDVELVRAKEKVTNQLKKEAALKEKQIKADAAYEQIRSRVTSQMNKGERETFFKHEEATRAFHMDRGTIPSEPFQDLKALHTYYQNRARTRYELGPGGRRVGRFGRGGYGGGGYGGGGSFFGSSGNSAVGQLRHMIGWHLLAPVIGGAAMAGAHYIGAMDSGDHGAYKLSGVGYGAPQREQAWNQAMFASATTPYVSPKTRLAVHKELASGLNLGTTPEAIEKTGALSRIAEFYAIQAEQPPREATRTLVRLMTEIKRNNPKYAKVSQEEGLLRAASMLGTIQESSSMTGPEATTFVRRAGASLAKRGWDPGSILGFATYPIEAGVSPSEMSVFAKKIGSGKLTEFMANTQLVYAIAKENAKTKGQTVNAIPSEKELNRFNKKNPRWLIEERSRIMGKLKDPRSFMVELFDYATKARILAGGGFKATKLMDRQSANILAFFSDFSPEEQAEQLGLMDKAKRAHDDPSHFQKNMKEAGKIVTPAQQFQRLTDLFGYYATLSGKNAQSIGQNATLNNASAVVGYFGGNSAISYAMHRGDTEGTTKEIEKIKKLAKDGVGSPVSDNRKAMIKKANDSYYGGFESTLRDLPILGYLATPLTNVLWQARVLAGEAGLNASDALVEGFKKRAATNFYESKGLGFPKGSPTYHEGKVFYAKPGGTSIGPGDYPDPNDPTNWAANGPDTRLDQLRERDRIVDQASAPMVNISPLSLQGLADVISKGNGGAGELIEGGGGRSGQNITIYIDGVKSDAKAHIEKDPAQNSGPNQQGVGGGAPAGAPTGGYQ